MYRSSILPLVGAIVLYAVNIINGHSVLQNSSPIVCISDGCIEGQLTPGYRIDHFESFFNIPFAQPPVGKLRFANPVPNQPWKNVLDGKHERKRNCAQKNLLVPEPKFEGVEDCLYLSVFRPANVSAAKNSSLPVMVYIFEGGFFGGSITTDTHGPHYIMDTQKAIFVMMNYRVGVLGFLSTGDAASTGNFALKDQLLALKWINRNIKAFGGNPKNVTIMGASAGGISTHMHMMSPASRGLFQRVVAMSGLATAPYNQLQDNPIDLARQQAQVVGVGNTDEMNSFDLVEELRAINVSTLVNSIDHLKFWSIDPITLYRPSIEPQLPGAFVTEDIVSVWTRGDFQQVPWMTGVVPNEGTVRAAEILTNKSELADLNANLNLLLPSLMGLVPKNASSYPVIVDRLRKFYLNGEDTISESNAQGFIEMYSHRSFYHPLYKTIEQYLAYANVSENPVYLYNFAYKGNLSYTMQFTGTDIDFGVGHIDDLIYFFKSPAVFPDENDRSSPRAQVTRALVDTYVEFAVTGVPKIWNDIELCTSASFHRRDFCEYQQFRNLNGNISDSRLEVRNSDEFNLELIGFWDELLAM